MIFADSISFIPITWKNATRFTTPVITYCDTALYHSPVPGKTHNKNWLRMLYAQGCTVVKMPCNPLEKFRRKENVSFCIFFRQIKLLQYTIYLENSLIPDAFKHVRGQNTFSRYKVHQISPPMVDFAWFLVKCINYRKVTQLCNASIDNLLWSQRWTHGKLNKLPVCILGPY